MPRHLILIGLLVFATFLPAALRYSVNAEGNVLTMTINCPSKVYVGESFFCQVIIQNTGNDSHEYELLWIIDNPQNNTPTFETSGTIEPNETIYTGQSFTFSDAENAYLSSFFLYNDHEISIILAQDGYTLTKQVVDIHVLAVDMSLVPQIQPIPVLPNSTFSLNLMVLNEGDDAINVTVRVYEVRNVITLQSGSVAEYGQIAARSFANQTFTFAVSPTATPGEYPVKVIVSYADSRGDIYSRNYYVPIPVSSGGVADALSLFKSTTENTLNRLRSDLDLTSRNLDVIGAVLLAVSVGLAIANYWHAKRMLRIRRKITA